MLTTAGEARLTSGANENWICSRDDGTGCARRAPGQPTARKTAASAAIRDLRSILLPSVAGILAGPARGAKRKRRYCGLVTSPLRGEVKLRLGLLGLFGLLGGGAAVLALGLGIAVDQLDHRHRCRIAIAEAGLQH